MRNGVLLITISHDRRGFSLRWTRADNQKLPPAVSAGSHTPPVTGHLSEAASGRPLNLAQLNPFPNDIWCSKQSSRSNYGDSFEQQMSTYATEGGSEKCP